MKKIILFSSIGLVLIFTLILFLWKDVYITLNGEKSTTINVYNTYEEKGFKALYCTKLFKLNCKDISNKVQIENNIDINILGDYEVKYNINYKGIKKSIIRNIKVADLESPIINLKYADEVATCPNTKYIEEGFEVTDNYDTDLNGKVTSIEKDGKVYYTVTDNSNNTTNIVRDIRYGDKEKPIITLKGYSTEYVLLGTNYKENGFTAIDNCDGDITDKVKTSNNVDKNKKGTYKATYTVEDLNNNKTTIERTIKVYEKQSYTTVIPTGKVVYLTFDDGPCVYTKKLLDVLKKYNVKATFFVTNQMSKYNNYIKREFDEGHSIGVHT